MCYLYLNAEGQVKLDIQGSILSGTTCITDGVYHHIAAVVPDMTDPTAADIAIYIDGVVESLTVSDPNILVDTICANEPNIAVACYDEDEYIGAIDDIRFYDTALSASEIANLADYDMTNDTVSGLVAHYPLDCSTEEEVSGYDGVILGCSCETVKGDVWHFTTKTSDSGTGDSDGDGIIDSLENAAAGGSSALLADTDGDGIDDAWEAGMGSDLLVASNYYDSDGDGIPDWYEYKYDQDLTDTIYGIDPQDDETFDNDGLVNLDEYLNNCSAINWDTDGDGIWDGWEVDNSNEAIIPYGRDSSTEMFGIAADWWFD